MRMRLKKNLEQRLADCQSVILERETADFYGKTDEQKTRIHTTRETFGNDNKLVLEIGCGKGAWAVTSAKLHPDVNYLAVEKLSNVIVDACEKAVAENLANLRFFNCGAENLPYFLPEKSVDEIVLNFSCPFPKKTYANRRLTHKNYLNKYKKLLKDDGVIKMKTDDNDFFEWSLESLADNGFEVYDVTRDLHANEPEDNVMTEYERKFVSQYVKINALKAKMK